MRKELVAVVCTACNGAPDVFLAVVNCSEEQYDNGDHYDTATRMARDEGYEAPFKCFDNSEHSEFLFAATVITKYRTDNNLN